jgi:choice-of-anchor A domain-containing protein
MVRRYLECAVLWAFVLTAFACQGVPDPAAPEPAAALNTQRQEANSVRKVLILGSTVSGGLQSQEARAVQALPPNPASFQADVVTPAQWKAMTAQQFMSYRALIIGDAGCTQGTAAWQAALETRSTWGAVVDGNIIAIGSNLATNSVSEASGEINPIMLGAMDFATEVPSRTGIYISLGCAYQNAPMGTEVELLAPFGSFKVAGMGCVSQAHVPNQVPPTFTQYVSDEQLAGVDGCPAKSVFTGYPQNDFSIAGLALEDVAGTMPGAQTLYDYDWTRDFTGTPFILTRGATSSGFGCGGDLSNEPERDDCDLGDNGNGSPQQGTNSSCSWACKWDWCGDGIVQAYLGEECDNGRANGRDVTRGGIITNGMCSRMCRTVDIPNQPPVSRCKNVSVTVTNTCGAAASIDDGSYDPENELVGCVQSPAGPYNIGDTTVMLTCTDAKGVSSSCSSTVSILDVTAPALVLLGPASVELQCNVDPYTEQGATASDLCSGSITPAISGMVNTQVPALYTLTYEAADTATPTPNVSRVTRSVTVFDTLEPAITLSGMVNQAVECSATGEYVDPGATASDVCSGDLTGAIVRGGTANPRVPGLYTLTYDVKDPSNNAAGQKTRVVTVSDTQDPVVTVLPGPSVLRCDGAPYVDPGATAFDLCAGDLTQQLSVTSNLNQSRPGRYTVTYSATDSAGNASTASRQLAVAGAPIHLSDYNLFLLEDYNGGHDVLGKVAAGGNITMQQFAVGSGLHDQDTSRVLVAGGNLTLSRGGIWGDAFYGGNYSADGTVVQHRGSVAQGAPIDFDARFAELRALSTDLAIQPANGTASREPWGGVMLSGTDPRVNIFHVNASAFIDARLFSIDAPAGSLVVVNIHGASATFTGFGHSFSGGIDQHGVLYNFVEATQINAHGYGFWGTVLAPYAHITFNNGSWDGGIYAVSLTGNAEGHINALTDRVFCP